MANNHDIVAVNDDRLNESVLADRFGHIRDLHIVVLLGIFVVRLQLAGGSVDDIHKNLADSISCYHFTQ